MRHCFLSARRAPCRESSSNAILAIAALGDDIKTHTGFITMPLDFTMRLLALTLLLTGVAHAGTVDLAQQLRLIDVEGTPIDGDQQVEFRLVSDDDPNDADTVCFTQVSDTVSFEDGYAAIKLAGVDDACFDSPQWLAISIGSPAVEFGTRIPITAVPLAAHASTATTAVTATTADAINGVTFGQSGQPTQDIKAYIDGQLCERFGGTWDSSSASCDANMEAGSGSYTATSCPSGYYVCSIPQVMDRAQNTTFTGWHWAAHESGNPSTGNMDSNSSRHAILGCPSGNAPLIHLGTANHGGSKVNNVICYTSGYIPLCCR
ncbi:MAG: hypothetical protein ACJAZO_002412 [Myxococcota bacterium]|jgi:hypothetical protein